MRIGMVLDNEFTGDPRVENEVRSLSNAGFKVSVLCYSFGNKPLIENFHGARIIRLKVSRKAINKIKGLNNTFFNLFPIYWSKKIRLFIKDEKITHLHVHDLWMIESALKANRKFNLPLIVDLHENFVHALSHYKYSTTFPGKYLISQEKWKRDEPKWLKKADNIIVVIEEAKERLIKLGIDFNKISVVSNYVDINRFTNDMPSVTEVIKNQNRSHYVITYTGGFDIHRGLDVAISAIPLLVNKIPNIKLKLVGGGSNEKQLKKLVQSLNIEEHIDFAGYQPHNQLVSYIKASNICIVPHLKTPHTDNTIPHKLFQYMIEKKPVIVSNCAPLERIVSSTEAGVVYNNKDHKDCALKILELYNTDYKRLGNNGYRAVISKYNWKTTAKNLTNLYKN